MLFCVPEVISQYLYHTTPPTAFAMSVPTGGIWIHHRCPKCIFHAFTP